MENYWVEKEIGGLKKSPMIELFKVLNYLMVW